MDYIFNVKIRHLDGTVSLRNLIENAIGDQIDIDKIHFDMKYYNIQTPRGLTELAQYLNSGSGTVVAELCEFGTNQNINHPVLHAVSMISCDAEKNFWYIDSSIDSYRFFMSRGKQGKENKFFIPLKQFGIMKCDLNYLQSSSVILCFENRKSQFQ